MKKNIQKNNKENLSYKKNRTTTINAIILVVISTILTSVGQVVFKYSTKNITDIWSIFTNVLLLVGFICYGGAAVLLITALKNGELSVLYPIVALSFVWVTLLSIVLFNEQVTIHNWIGIFCIIAGITLVGMGGKQ